ncbi:MAG: hypothetical protein WBF17_19840 [Phycisphaerae bacterium]
MSKRLRGKKAHDACVIYYSRGDGCWIAHGLHTDQIGTGDCVVHALADLMIALQELADLAAEDPSIAMLREAPPAIQRKARSAQPLPRELYEIAHKMVHGQWPDIEVKIAPKRQQRFRAELETAPA